MFFLSPACAPVVVLIVSAVDPGVPGWVSGRWAIKSPKGGLKNYD
jgi:hypothetical protein